MGPMRTSGLCTYSVCMFAAFAASGDAWDHLTWVLPWLDGVALAESLVAVFAASLRASNQVRWRVSFIRSPKTYENWGIG